MEISNLIPHGVKNKSKQYFFEKKSKQYLEVTKTTDVSRLISHKSLICTFKFQPNTSPKLLALRAATFHYCD